MADRSDDVTVKTVWANQREDHCCYDEDEPDDDDDGGGLQVLDLNHDSTKSGVL